MAGKWKRYCSKKIQHKDHTGNHYRDFYQALKNENKHIFPYQFIKSTDTVAACGCNNFLIPYGVSQALIFSTLAKKVIVFEPDVRNIEIYSRYLDEHKIENVEIIDKAVWKEEGDLQLFSGKADKKGASQIVRGDYSGNSLRCIQATTLDNSLEKVDYLHLTINNSEYEALLGAQRILSQGPIVSIAMINARHHFFPHRMEAVEHLEKHNMSIGWAVASPHPWKSLNFWFATACKDPEVFLSLGYKEIEREQFLSGGMI